jgi:hypothetical protein
MMLNSSSRDLNSFYIASNGSKAELRETMDDFANSLDTSKRSGEVLEPTADNLRRMELKNQRRDIQNSLASSSINEMISNFNIAKARSNHGAIEDT